MSSPVPSTARWPTTYAVGGLVCSVDHLASSAGAEVLAAGGTAADAAVAASAVLAVTTPHMCGVGGDLFALVHGTPGPPEVLHAAGRAGGGADPARLRAEGHTEVPPRGDVRAATVPGCVDGWAALSERHGRLGLAAALAPARRLAEGGFPVSPLLAFMLHELDGVEGCDELALPRPDAGDLLRRPDLARTLAAVAEHGRAGFYEGAFGEGLLAVGGGEYVAEDLTRVGARWIEPLGAKVWGHDVWTVPPPSQGYLTLAAALVVERLGRDVPPSDDDAWAHLVVEASRLVGADRPDVLHDAAEAAGLLAEERLDVAVDGFDPERRSPGASPAGAGDTIHLAVVDRDGMGVSLIQSNAAGFGCHVAVPGTGVLLHNRGIGFSLEEGHPAELAPGRTPPHTLAPAAVTRPDGTLRLVLGTMGGDSQPQVVLQLLVRLLVEGAEPGPALDAPRAVLGTDPPSGFATWTAPHQVVRVEGHAPEGWAPGLTRRGHDVRVAGVDPAGFGHAHVIEVRPDGVRAGASDVRAMTGAAVAAP